MGERRGETATRVSLHRRLAGDGVGELVVLVVLFIGYNVVRGYAGDDVHGAIRHALALVRWEGPGVLRVERDLNHWLTVHTLLAVLACYLYAVLHYVTTPTVLLLSRARGGWPYWRGYWALVLASAIAVVVYALYPVAPPRLTPGLDIVDVLRRYSDWGWWGGAASAPRGIGDATNQYAALPSMHIGWAVWCSVQLWQLGDGTWRGGRTWRVLAVAYPLVLTFVVIATGNHFVADVLAGAACTALAFVLVEMVHRVWLGRTGPQPAP